MYLPIAQVPDTAPKTTINVTPDPIQPFGWRDVANGISSGAWAIVLVLGVGFIMFRKSAVGFIEAQTEVLRTVKDGVKNNTETLAKIADTDKSLADTMAKMASTDIAVEARLSKIVVYLGHMNKKLDGLKTDPKPDPKP